MQHFSQEEKEKQWTESHKSRVESDFCLKNLENREEKKSFCLKIWKNREEKWKYNYPAQKYESFLLKIFSRWRLLSVTAPPPLLKKNSQKINNWMKYFQIGRKYKHIPLPSIKVCRWLRRIYYFQMSLIPFDGSPRLRNWQNERSAPPYIWFSIHVEPKHK